MLTQRTDTSARFTRQEIPRLAIAAGVLILALAAILGADLLSEPPLIVSEGQLATRDIVAPRAADFDSTIRTAEARNAASAQVPPQYSFTTENAIVIAAAQQIAFEKRIEQIDTTFSTDLTGLGRAALLQTAVPGLSDEARATLIALDPARWAAVRTESA